MFLIAAPVAFMALMPLFDWLATSDLLNPWSRVHDMIKTHSTLTFHAYHPGNASRPWEWVLSPHAMAFWYTPSYYSGVNWTMWALIIPTALYAIYGSIKRNPLLLFVILWFASTYLVWFPVYFLTDRFMFRFYFYPTVGAICLGLGFAISQILRLATKQNNPKFRWAIRGAIAAWMIANLSVFVAMSPLV
jgi:predicted membrane-bound dolichyl-phosphate-mannose-protein mannosyltransferase